MKQLISTNLLVLVATLAYNFLFWQEKMGLNSLIFTLLMIAILFHTHPESRRSKPALLTAFGTLLTAVLIVWNNSLLTKCIHILSFITMVGFVQARMLRFVWFGLLLGLSHLLFFPRKFSDVLLDVNLTGSPIRAAMRSFRLSVLPLFVVAAFYVIYYNANTAFSELSDNFWTNLFKFFSFDISFQRLLFFISGLILTGGMIWKYALPYFEKKQIEKQENLIRKRKNKAYIHRKISTLGLKNEYLMAKGLLIALNLLLLLVNILDIQHVWVGDIPDNPLLLKNYVHEGTYLLIAAILLAMTVVLFFFRKNLNFYPTSHVLQNLSYLWIAQNALLAISVFIRNAHYITTCGLAYKRIGVIVFLLLTLFGLFTLWYKIRKKKTFYFLLQYNAWAVYMALVITSFVNWDAQITRFNLHKQFKNGIDTDFLIHTISDKNLYLLEANIQKMVNFSNSFLPNSITQIPLSIERKRAIFEQKQQSYSWLSWNYPDFRNKNASPLKD